MEKLRALAGRCRRSIEEWLGSADLLRAGLVSGAVTVALGGFAVPVLYTLDTPDPSAGENEVAGVEPALSRLPRPRPDAPETTGSIRPSASAAEPAPSRAAASARHLAELQTRAVLIAASWSECDQVESSELYELPGSGPDEIMVRIHCGNGTRFVLGESDIAANRIASRAPASEPNPQPPIPTPVSTPTLAELALQDVIPTIGEPAPGIAAPLTDADVVRACEEKVAQGLPFPGSLNRALATTGIARLSGDAIVTFDFDALNGFGFPLFFRVECVFENRELARLELSPR